jgi:hypothetical protein
MNEQEKLESYARERMSHYIEFMFNAASGAVQEDVLVLLENHLGETSADLWNQSKQVVDILWDMDERLADIDNKNKE